ncbi:NAD(P)H-hydrate dehydratase [Pedobacter namyangjuensis]|uniref:NAD(P)H-hydrate dehydratase n=1 Tax=Pedobacter namyangjuensis TaxID=600626 RepID=UPI000DE48A5E|nr:NAD(P)H-hydrate dehydratase [Pedobacter namyangjuensis]
MQNLLTAQQIRNADAYTIQRRNISAIDLMEDAAKAFVKAFKKEVLEKNKSISIFCGQGNNGADGLAIARLLSEKGYKEISIYLLNFGKKESDEFTANFARLRKTNLPVTKISSSQELNAIKTDIVIDAILGSGLNRPLTPQLASVIKHINSLDAKIVAVDIPTGLFSEGEIALNYDGIKADLTITFQLPKINFFFPESANAQNKFKVVDIGLDQDFVAKQDSQFKLIEASDVRNLIKPRRNFSHKGTYGHAVLVAGNDTTMGAAILATTASVYSGAGLSTVCLPQSGLIAINTILPEAMVLPRKDTLRSIDFEKFTAIAFGPGLGVTTVNENLLDEIISLQKPMVIDADGLTILSKRKDLLERLPASTILTPHLKEFDRLFGEHKSWWHRLETARKEAKRLKIIIVLKNQFTFICTPGGDVFINSTGSPAMASGGMGDVLTGIMVSLLAQKYSPIDVATVAVYLHGKAGDELSKNRFTVTASKLALQIPKTIKRLLKDK